MNNRTGLGLGVLAASLALGVLGDALLRATPWGLNGLAWVAALVAAVAILARWRRLAVTGERRALALPLLFFGAAFAWRDSPALQGLNGLALLVLLALAALRTRSGHLRVASLTEYLRGVFMLGFQLMAGLVPLLCGDIQWKRIPRGRGLALAAAVGRGLAIALPLLLLFGGLFVAADAVFERMVTRLFDWSPDEVLMHFLVTAYCAWISAGILHPVLLPREWKDPAGEPSGRLSLGIVEIGVALGLLNALFLAFVAVQVRYLFGGTAHVMATAGLTCADYARRGFFELVAVTALALPVLLSAHALLRKENPAHERAFRALAGVLVALLFVIMASAVQRMRLYQESYGQTELRLYVSAFMGWMAVVFVWFLATVLRGRRERFAFGALVTGFVAIALLDAFNPDALIARANATHRNAARFFDASYVTSLSADAVPTLVAVLPAVPAGKRALAASELIERWSRPPSRDWRTWNHSRAKAWQAVRASEPRLQEMAGSRYNARKDR